MITSQKELLPSRIENDHRKLEKTGMDFEEKVLKELLDELRLLVKPHLINMLGSMEASMKKSKYGKQKRVGLYIKH